MLTIIATVVLISVAAVTDWRKGEIPNWLTLPPLLIAPFFWYCTQGLQGLQVSLVGMVGCGLVPYCAFRVGAMGGGDVKLFAALGAVNGLDLGMEMLMLSLFAAVVQTLILLARKRRLMGCLKNCWLLIANMFMPRRHRREISVTSLTELRMGPAIAVGAILSLVLS